MSEAELMEALTRANNQLQSLQTRVSELERKTSRNATLPTTNLLSDKFLTRAFAVLGHYLVAGLIITIPIYVLIFVVLFVLGVDLQ